ncbi:MAG: DUF3168 domain-containing protein [Nitratireductor sp.]
MKALSVVFQILSDDAGVTAARSGPISINAIPDAQSVPNVQLMLVSGLEEFTHGGPSGLVEDRVRVWCRAKTPKEAAALGQAVHDALQGYVGTVDGAAVQLIRRVMTTSDYQDAAKVHRHIADFDVHWGAA